MLAISCCCQHSTCVNEVPIKLIGYDFVRPTSNFSTIYIKFKRTFIVVTAAFWE